MEDVYTWFLIAVFLAYITIMNIMFVKNEIENEKKDELVTACQYECKAGKILLHPNQPNGCFIPMDGLTNDFCSNK